MAELGTRNRAKVYQLNGAGQWDDRGTGYAACQYLQVRSMHAPAGAVDLVAWIMGWLWLSVSRGAAGGCGRTYRSPAWHGTHLSSSGGVSVDHLARGAGRTPGARAAHIQAACCRCSACAPTSMPAPCLVRPAFARVQAYGFACIILVSEEDSTPILETRVSADDIYQRQGGTIISWTEPANGCDVALSFADAAGCSDFWEEIQAMQRAEVQSQAGNGPFGLSDGGGGNGSSAGGGGGQLGSLISLADERGGMLGGGLRHEMGGHHEMSVNLPAPELRNVKALAEVLSETTFYQRPAVVQLILQQGYVSQLAQLFQTVEDLESLPELHAMFHIFRTLMMLNDTAIFEQLLREENVMSVIGALEYDPELLVHATRHREFLTSVVVFREVLPIRDQAILAKARAASCACRRRARAPRGRRADACLCAAAAALRPAARLASPLPAVTFPPHAPAAARPRCVCPPAPSRRAAARAQVHQNFRVQYIKDVVLPRSLDDHTFATLNSIVFVNNVAILSHIQGDSDYLTQLFTQLQDASQPLERRRELSRLLLELCQLARSLQIFNRASFYRRMLEFGLFQPVASLLMSGDPILQLNAAEMLGASCLHDPSILRQFILLERPAQQTMEALMHVLTRGAEAGVKAQVAEVLRSLLDPETMDGPEQEEFLNAFYDRFIPMALAPLDSAAAEGEGVTAGAPNGDGSRAAAAAAAAGGDERAEGGGGRGAASAAAGGSAEMGDAAADAGGGGAGGQTPAASASAALGEDGAAADEADRAAEPRGERPPLGAGGVDAPGGGGGEGKADGGCAAGSASATAPLAPRPQAAQAGAAAATAEGDECVDEEALHASRSLVVELLCYCVLHHGMRAGTAHPCAGAARASRPPLNISSPRRARWPRAPAAGVRSPRASHPPSAARALRLPHQVLRAQEPRDGSRAHAYAAAR